MQTSHLTKLHVDNFDAQLPTEFARTVTDALADWRKNDKLGRLWAGDATLWTGTGESNWLGWLDIVDRQLADAKRFGQMAAEARNVGLTHVLLLGMGGSSLCAEVLSRTFGQVPGYPKLLVLDSTDPAQVRTFEERVEPTRTLFVVSSKSGTTVEVDSLKRYFFECMCRLVGQDRAPEHFVAITDPGSPLEKAARAEGFRSVYHGMRNIGGRFSALSDFGMAPAALTGIDVPEFLRRAGRMVHACGNGVAPERNPGAVLGVILGVGHNLGCNKLTVVASPRIRGFGAWLEQLLAESTGKNGKAIIPIDGEELQQPDCYGTDRLFVYLRLDAAPDAAQDAGIARLEQAGYPIVRIRIPDIYELGAEFFRWEFATAVAGAIIGINPFNQPDVEASKAAARRFTTEFEQTGQLPAETPMFHEAGLKLFAAPDYATRLRAAAGNPTTITEYLQAHFAQLNPGDYLAVLAFIQMTDRTEHALQEIRQMVLQAKHVATSAGFGPRYLHSTGQAHKGGPNTGVFLLLTCDDAFDLPVPGRKYSFSVLKTAQARGDFEVLAERGRRVLRVHLPADLETGLTRLQSAIRKATY